MALWEKHADQHTARRPWSDGAVGKAIRDTGDAVMGRYDMDWLTLEIEEAQAWHRARVDRLYAGDELDSVVAIAGPLFGPYHPLIGTTEIDMLEEPEAWFDSVVGHMAESATRLASRATFVPLAVELDPLGVHFIDALLGAKTYFHEGQAWSDQLECEVADLEMPDLDASPILRKALDLAKFVVEAGDGRLLISTPVLSCAINTAINILGERFLEVLAIEPGVAMRALRIINDVLVAVTEAFFEVISTDVRRNSAAFSRYAPAGFGQVDGCATQLVSAAHYCAFLADLDSELLSVSPHGGMIHLCGTHEHHIPAFREMDRLRSVQINDRATDGLAEFVEGLREDQILYITPTEATSVEDIMDLTDGRRIVLQAYLEEPLSIRC
ncbi:MAG TPA: hypothetical protein QGH10_11625 [Armatimonadota bacterium]|nr:hypothetical protein [Armatimonadota bacterium]